MTTSEATVRHRPGRWLYVVPASLIAVAGWMVFGQRANSTGFVAVSPFTIAAESAQAVADQYDRDRFLTDADGKLVDQATGLVSIYGPDSRIANLGTDEYIADLRAGEGPRPVRVRARGIRLNASVIPIGLDRSRALAVPARADITGWWSGGAIPGEVGPTVIVGHFDSKITPGVFQHLKDVSEGDEVSVEQSDGSIYTYEVNLVERLKKTAFPTEKVYGRTDASTLRLVTCGGEFDHTTGHYVDNTIVYADFVSAEIPEPPPPPLPPPMFEGLVPGLSSVLSVMNTSASAALRSAELYVATTTTSSTTTTPTSSTTVAPTTSVVGVVIDPAVTTSTTTTTVLETALPSDNGGEGPVNAAVAAAATVPSATTTTTVPGAGNAASANVAELGSQSS